MIENLGANRYLYSLTRLQKAPARGPTVPALAVPPAGAREIGLIEVSTDYGGAGAGGLRDSESDFYPMLTVDVLAARSPP